MAGRYYILNILQNYLDFIHIADITSHVLRIRDVVLIGCVGSAYRCMVVLSSR